MMQFPITPSNNDITNRAGKIDIRKIYIEPTTECNLSCTTCLRNVWDEENGHMTEETFNKLIADIKEIDTIEEVSIWGMGEPLSHPNIAGIISAFSKMRIRTELISNGMLLNENMAQQIIDSGLKKLIISVDSTSNGQFEAIRAGAKLNTVLNNINKLNQLKYYQKKAYPEIGIEFTAMKSNVSELKHLRELARTMQASFIIVTNVLPYTEEYKDEILYSMSATSVTTKTRTPQSPEIFLPRVDIRNDIYEHMGKISFEALSLGPNPGVDKRYNGICPYVDRGALAVSRNGDISPCVPLLHNYTCYILGRKKEVKKHFWGNIHNSNLLDIWNKKEYQAFRGKLIEGTFSPCVECGGCEMSDSNREDCFGNTAPTCGDCLWAKGVIQCP